MTYEKRQLKWPWRDFLTAQEAETLRQAAIAKQAWLGLNRERATITNRALQRAKYHFQNYPSPPSSPVKDEPTVSTSISKPEPQNEAESKTSIEREKP